MICSACNGTGWIITERSDGVSGADRCGACAVKLRRPSRRPDPDQFADAMEKMQNMIPWFPTEDRERAFILTQIEAEVDSRAQLDRFVQAACMLDKWQGLGVLFRAYEQAAESDYYEREHIETSRRIEAWRNQYALESGGAREPLRLPAPTVAPMPEIEPEPVDPVLARRERIEEEARERARDRAAGERLYASITPAQQRRDRSMTAQLIREMEQAPRKYRPAEENARIEAQLREQLRLRRAG